MLTTETGTQTRILAAAKTEFLEKGFPPNHCQACRRDNRCILWVLFQ